MNTVFFDTLSDLNTKKNIQYNNKNDIFSVKENLWERRESIQKKKKVLGSNDWTLIQNSSL